jgi:hypothetical protein
MPFTNIKFSRTCESVLALFSELAKAACENNRSHDADVEMLADVGTAKTYLANKQRL